MKNRLSALDGLRGFAAFSVLLSHSGFGIQALTSIPFLIAAYKTLSVGPNSVQILFVLSGFFMAFLYPHIPDIFAFIKKRYARIIPVYGVIVIYLWIVSQETARIPWPWQILLLIGIASSVYLIWNLLKKYRKEKVIGNFIFFSYLILQAIMAIVNTFITPHYVSFGQLIMPDPYKHILIGLSNLTLTTPFSYHVPRLSGVFWSLAPEIYFYLLYPFIVIPLVMLAKRFGPVAGFLIVLSILKILFDLDHALVSIAGFQSINIARSRGFVIGVVVGTLYHSKGAIWQWLEALFKNPFVSVCALILFTAIQWGDWAVRDGQSITFMNTYYLVSSIVVGILIISAVISRTVVHRLFSNRILVYLGFISYSIYLIHVQAIEWSGHIIKSMEPSIRQQFWLSTVTLLTFILLTVGISTVLFRLVEHLYFQSKQKKKEVVSSITKDEIKSVTHHIPQKRTYLALIGALLIIIVVYAGSYSPTFLVQHHPFSNSFLPVHSEISLLDHTVRVPITPQHSNLSGMTVDLRYFKSAEVTRTINKNPAVLYFRIYDKTEKIFESQRHGYEIEGTPRFPLGFPTLANSKDHTYTIEFELKNGSKNDQVFIDTSSTSLVTMYPTSKKDLLHNPFLFVWNRLLFILSSPSAIFACMFILAAMYGVYKSRPITASSRRQ